MGFRRDAEGAHPVRGAVASIECPTGSNPLRAASVRRGGAATRAHHARGRRWAERRHGGPLERRLLPTLFFEGRATDRERTRTPAEVPGERASPLGTEFLEALRPARPCDPPLDPLPRRRAESSTNGEVRAHGKITSECAGPGRSWVLGAHLGKPDRKGSAKRPAGGAEGGANRSTRRRRATEPAGMGAGRWEAGKQRKRERRRERTTGERRRRREEESKLTRRVGRRDEPDAHLAPRAHTAVDKNEVVAHDSPRRRKSKPGPRGSNFSTVPNQNPGARCCRRLRSCAMKPASRRRPLEETGRNDINGDTHGK